jgi:hypothetical protein
MSDICPGCGRCRECGQPAPLPVIPYPVPQPTIPYPQPWREPVSPLPERWQPITITCSTALDGRLIAQAIARPR